MEKQDGADPLERACREAAVAERSHVERAAVGLHRLVVAPPKAPARHAVGVCDHDIVAGVTFAATTLTEVERIALATGNSYKLTLHDGTNATTLTVDDPNLQMHTAAELKAELEQGLERNWGDVNPLKVLRTRK